MNIETGRSGSSAWLALRPSCYWRQALFALALCAFFFSLDVVHASAQTILTSWSVSEYQPNIAPGGRANTLRFIRPITTSSLLHPKQAGCSSASIGAFIGATSTVCRAFGPTAWHSCPAAPILCLSPWGMISHSEAAEESGAAPMAAARGHRRRLRFRRRLQAAWLGTRYPSAATRAQSLLVPSSAFWQVQIKVPLGPTETCSEAAIAVSSRSLRAGRKCRHCRRACRHPPFC